MVLLSKCHSAPSIKTFEGMLDAGIHVLLFMNFIQKLPRVKSLCKEPIVSLQAIATILLLLYLPTFSHPLRRYQKKPYKQLRDLVKIFPIGI
ncbi:MAG: hypothetical protein HY279_03920 [Nitrospinae bacterium]|nr:hypothetical protein [Nitrospinota bacterium]